MTNPTDDFRPFTTEYLTRDGARILIRTVTLDDAEAMHDVMSQPRATWGTLQMPMALPARRRAMLESNETNAEITSFGAEVDGRLVGCASLHMNSRRYRMRHAAGLGMSVHDDFHGQRIGTALMSAMVEYADEWLNVHRLELTVFTDNVAGIALYKRAGFEIEGTHRDYAWRQGRYVDAHMMARISPVAH